MKKEIIEEKVNQMLGKTSALFMTQECKGTEIIMPTKELVEISDELISFIEQIYKQGWENATKNIQGAVGIAGGEVKVKGAGDIEEE